MTIGARFREVRDYLCLTVADAAACAGLDDGDLLAIEKDERSLDELEIQRLARAYGYPAAYFRDSYRSMHATTTGQPRLLADLTEHDRGELARFTAFVLDTAGS